MKHHKMENSWNTLKYNIFERDVLEAMRNDLLSFQVDQVGQLLLKDQVDPAVESNRLRGNNI